MPLAMADGMRKVLHVCEQIGNYSCSSSCPSAGFGCSGTGRGNAKHFISRSSLHTLKLLKGSERDWLEHVVQSGWMKKRMWDKLDVVGSFPIPLTEPFDKLQTGLSQPSFLPAVSTNGAAVIEGFSMWSPVLQSFSGFL